MALVPITLAHYLIVSVILFSLGLVCVLTRRNAVGVLMGTELILNAANLNFVAFNRYGAPGIDGQLVAIFTIVIAAAAAAVALAIVLSIFRNLKSIETDRATALRN